MAVFSRDGSFFTSHPRQHHRHDHRGHTGNRVAIEVSDDGPGVPPEALPHIFERFYRAGSPGTRGSGLGLAIAAEIAAAHGGTAEAARAFPRGLRIRLSLPDYASPRRMRTAAAPSSTSA